MARLLLISALLAGCSTAQPHGTEATHTAFKDALFRATHNSYSGGDRGTIAEQLEAGVRFIEFDVQVEDDHFAVGHDAPGKEVALGDGNPDTTDLTAWLNVVATWTAANPDHALVTIATDIKDNFDDGTIEQLEAIYESAFGEQLLHPGDVDANTEAETLAGRVLLVLTGNVEARARYGVDGPLFYGEFQKANPESLEPATFYAASQLDYATAQTWKDKDAVIRLWGLNIATILEMVPVTFPATDTPYAPWYEDYCNEHGALK